MSVTAALDRRGDGAGDARRARRARCRRRSSGISIDSRTIAPGEAFFAIKGDNRDGHDSCRRRSQAAPALRWSPRPTGATRCRAMRRCSSCRRARRLARARARRARALARQGHRASPARSARPAPRRRCGSRSSPAGETHASVASYNNHWGVPLSLARCPASARFAVFEIGMNHAGRDRAADAAGAAACRDRHHGRAGASGILRLGRGDRRRQGRDLRRPRAGRRGGAQPRQRAIRTPAARARRTPASRASSPSASTQAPTRG